MTDLADKIADWATPRRVLRAVLYAAVAVIAVTTLIGIVHTIQTAP